MKYTYYRFTTEDGTRYTVTGNNRFQAQSHIELGHHIDLTGATFEEVYKGKVEMRGIVK